MEFVQGYYFYKEYDVCKVIYVFTKGDFGDGDRFYYFDLGEKSIRSFSSINTTFTDRCEAIEDMDFIKVYRLQLAGEIELYEQISPKLLNILKQKIA